MRLFFCENCNKQFAINMPIVGKCVSIGLGATIASQIENPWLRIFALLGSAWVGNKLDEAHVPGCPECGLFLRLIGEINY